MKIELYYKLAVTVEDVASVLSSYHECENVVVPIYLR